MDLRFYKVAHLPDLKILGPVELRTGSKYGYRNQHVSCFCLALSEVLFLSRFLSPRIILSLSHDIITTHTQRGRRTHIGDLPSLRRNFAGKIDKFTYPIAQKVFDGTLRWIGELHEDERLVFMEIGVRRQTILDTCHQRRHFYLWLVLTQLNRPADVG